MKRCFVFILLLTLLLSSFSFGYAVTVQIGSGTSYSSNFPLRGSSDYSYTQQIYTQEQINGAGNITKIRLYYTSGDITNNKDWTIYLGHTQKTAFNSDTDWEPLSNLTQVFSGDVTNLLPAADNWMEITLTTPFAYNNTDNLVLAVDENTSGSGNMRWGSFTSANISGIYYNGTDNPDPNNPPTASGRSIYINRIQLELAATSAPQTPTLVLPPNGAYAFEGHSLNWFLPIGSAGVTGYDVYLDGDLVSSQPESSYSITSAMGLGQHSWYVVAHNEIGASPASETRTFELVEPIIISGQSHSYGRTAPFNIYNGYGRSLGLYTTAQMEQVGQVMGLAWNVYTASTRAIPYKVYVKSTLDDALSPMTWDTFTDGATLVKEGTYTFDNIGWNTIALDVPFTYAGSNLLIGVESNYGSGAGNTNTPTFLSFDGGSGSHQQWQSSTPPTGEGNLNIYLPHLAVIMAPASTNPMFTFSPTEYNYDRMKINTTASRTITIGNAGSGTLDVTGISPSSSGYFSVTDAPAFPLSLTAGQTASFKVKYAPMSAGNHTATFTISHTLGTATLTVSGECYDATISSFPHLENFDGEWTESPAAPYGWTVINANNDGYTWTQSNSRLKPTHSEPYAARGTGNSNDWLISPPINLSGIDARVRWWDKVERSNHNNAYRVKVSTTTPEIASFTTELANINCNNTDWTQHTLDLDAYREQTIYLAFHQYYSGSTSSGFGLDDFRLEEIPTGPVFAYTPTAKDFYLVRVNTNTEYLDITVTNIGIGTLNLTASDLSFTGAGAAMFEFDPVGLPLALGADQSGVITVRYKPTALGAHNATFRIAYAGNNYDVVLSGEAVSESALYESFEDSDFPPPGWLKGNWSRSTDCAQHGSASAYRLASHNSSYTLNTPLLAIENGSKLNFWARCSAAEGWLQVVYSQNRSNWTQLGANLSFAEKDTWYNYEVDLSSLSGGNYYLGLRTGRLNAGFHVDRVVGPSHATVAPDVPTLLNIPVASVYPYFNWGAPTTGGIPTSYNVYCDTNNPPTTLIGNSETLSFIPQTPLPYSSTLYWTVTAVNAYGESAKPAARQFTTMADPTVSTYPFFEGFETGQTSSSQVKNWDQALDDGKTSYWRANTSTSNNRTPRTGTFNATLLYGANAWLTRPFSLEGGKSYDVEVWARQNRDNPSYASIGISYGSEGTVASLTNVIVAQTGIINGDYQLLSGSFTPETDGIYWIGIHGESMSISDNYISIDDITVRHSGPDILAGETYPVGNTGNISFQSSHNLWTVPNVDANTPAVAALPNLDAANSVISGYSCAKSGVTLTYSISEEGTWYLVGYWGAHWHHASPSPLIISGAGQSGTLTLSGIDFTGKGDVYVVLSKGDNPTLPMTLSHFAATLTAENFVQLTWISQSESNLMGYNVYRSANDDLSAAMQICPMIAGTNTSEAQTYSYLDKELTDEGTYYYWLQSVDLDGTMGFHGPVSVVFSLGGEGGSPAVPLVTQLDNAYPNPFNPDTTIRYQLENPAKVRIDIYNQKGQIVRSFNQNHAEAGHYQIIWDGCDNSGKTLASGVYIYKMTSGKYSAAKKLVLQK